MADHGDPGLAICFAVKIEGRDLGSFTSCDGLSVEVKVEQREEGGNNGFVHQLPGGLKYSNIKLTRPLGKDSVTIAEWFASMTNGVKRTTAVIRALTLQGQSIASWSLTGVIPVRWSGPSFSAESPKAATETLEIAHQGFVPNGRAIFSDA